MIYANDNDPKIAAWLAELPLGIDRIDACDIQDVHSSNLEMVGADRRGIVNIRDDEKRSICTSHVERNNGTLRLFIKRMSRLTYAFSKKLENHEAAISMFIAYYNFVWRTRYPDKSVRPGKLRPTAAMMAGVTDRLWKFDDFFQEVINYGF